MWESVRYKPSTTLKITRSGAWSKLVTMAASRSLSPNLISSTLIVSFSLMIGTASALEQRVQRVTHVEVARPAVKILVGQEQLGGVPSVSAQAVVVGADQVGLANRGGGLELRQIIRPALPSKLSHPAPTAPELTSATLHPRSITVLICSAR